MPAENTKLKPIRNEKLRLEAITRQEESIQKK
jgi:hypothetical protein